ncbi:aryl-alcohol dehydrogenase-like predicted oxidoreductase [Saccharopolyspora erythraea NRRL 2338]|uniref:Aldo/keto reductase n=2 Tax=Saccharopolyspora erythraea TaxID=1836 RepID=A4FIE9_SACEN|nr:aldo/keto reductase [Saccharopolyspora erythraea]EQD87875.1 aldo/keto reductase [Saccharopolyspora erythraea D]PFG97500.1 aryl-alcohol dehydrogenase-like predicted oxidoreductase [Saccharopolyspora erythraea NRRL 2338]QRK87674.1 aldo/keto reductase [Saccharopolyspora erythraea]CAM03824.1 aldo/keto reductase [Saccharopolyspora erythraea NRRL 2338]
MKPTRLPGTDVPLSPLVLGTMTFGDTVDAAAAGRMLDVALEAGITGVDTANGYAGGAAEEILAGLLRSRRDRVVLATKAGIPHPDAGEHSPLSARGLRAGVEGSLRRLGADRIDLFYLHQPDRAAPVAETLTTVAELVAEGKIGALGVSNYAAWQISELNRAADETGAPRPVVAQQLYNLLARRIEEEYAEFASATGLLTMVYNPLGGGLLTGRHSFGEQPSGGRFADSRVAEMYRQRYWNPELFESVAALAKVADDAGIGLTELSLRWLVSKPATGSVLLGGSKVEHLRANIAALDAGPLPADVVAACDEVGAALRGPMPAYNR